MRLQESGEMYLEAIHVLSKKLPTVRSVDICEHRGVSKPSVSRAVGILKKGGYIICADDGGLILTEKGKEVAAFVAKRAHAAISAVSKEIMTDEERVVFYSILDLISHRYRIRIYSFHSAHIKKTFVNRIFLNDRRILFANIHKCLRAFFV